MFIPPFFPEPIEVPGNVAHQPYDVRLGFIRNLTGLCFLGSAGSLAIGIWVPSPLPEWFASWSLLGLALLHSAWRKLFSAGASSAAMAASMHLAWGWAGAEWHRAGLPALALPLAAAGAALYVLIARRDFSFLGQFVIGSVMMCLGWLGLYELGWTPVSVAGWGWAIGLAALGYLTYDQAMIQKRRRPDEALASLCDLTSDMLNWLSYGIRIWAHWRRFKW